MTEQPKKELLHFSGNKLFDKDGVYIKEYSRFIPATNPNLAQPETRNPKPEPQPTHHEPMHLAPLTLQPDPSHLAPRTPQPKKDIGVFATCYYDFYCFVEQETKNQNSTPDSLVRHHQQEPIYTREYIIKGNTRYIFLKTNTEFSAHEFHRVWVTIRFKEANQDWTKYFEKALMRVKEKKEKGE